MKEQNYQMHLIKEIINKVNILLSKVKKEIIFIF